MSNSYVPGTGSKVAVAPSLAKLTGFVGVEVGQIINK